MHSTKVLLRFLWTHFKLIVAILSFVNCKAQDTLKEYAFPEVNWTLKIPAKFNLLDSVQFEVMARKGVNAINQTYDAGLSPKDINSLFTLRQGDFNLLGSTINLFDTTLEMTWQESYAYSKEMIIEVINQQAPTIKLIDTLSGSEIIDGLRFEKLYLKTFYPDRKLTMHTYWFYRKQNQYDFSINIAYTEEKIGKQFLDLVMSSKFSK